MQAIAAQWLVAVSGGEVLVFTSAVGWLARRTIRSQDRANLALQELKTQVAIGQVTGPALRADVDKLELQVGRIAGRQEALSEWTRAHDRWHQSGPHRT